MRLGWVGKKTRRLATRMQRGFSPRAAPFLCGSLAQTRIVQLRKQPLLLNTSGASRCFEQIDLHLDKPAGANDQFTLGEACRVVSRGLHGWESAWEKRGASSGTEAMIIASEHQRLGARERVQVGRIQNIRRQARRQASLRLRCMPATPVSRTSAETRGCENQAPTQGKALVASEV